jgi:hypothetical protein
LPADFAERRFVRGYLLVEDTGARRRQEAVAVGARAAERVPTPIDPSSLSMARAEIYAFHGPGHDDLWHMDWRARLVPVVPGVERDQATPLYREDVAAIASATEQLAANPNFQIFVDRFLDH